MAERFEGQVVGIAALGDPVRRRLYEHVVGATDAVSRDQAASAIGIKRALAAFHLDKLVDAGLLEVEYRRLTGRTGPGAGRPSKLYRRSGREFDVTLPPREYDLGAQVLATAVQRAAASGGDVIACVRQAHSSVASNSSLTAAGALSRGWSPRWPSTATNPGSRTAT